MLRLWKDIRPITIPQDLRRSPGRVDLVGGLSLTTEYGKFNLERNIPIIASDDCLSIRQGKLGASYTTPSGKTFLHWDRGQLKLLSEEDKIQRLSGFNDFTATLLSPHTLSHPPGIVDPDCPVCRLAPLDLELTMQIGKKSHGFGGQGAHTALGARLDLDMNSYDVFVQHKEAIDKSARVEIAAGYGRDERNKPPRSWLRIGLEALFGCN